MSDDLRREPLFKAPWPVAAGAGLILASIFANPELINAGALSRPALAEGRWWTLATTLFLHAGLLHVVVNAGSFAAMATPLLRHVFGPQGRGVLAFFAFYGLCGLAGSLAFLALNAQGAAVGASGAICGLWGGLARLSPQGFTPLFSLSVAKQIVPFAIMNLVILLAGLAAGMGIAWQAHLGGFLAGLLLIVPMTRWAWSA